jgi:hypothetical protein
MPDNDTRSITGRGGVRLENDRICVFERNGIYQARIKTEVNRYLWRSTTVGLAADQSQRQPRD